MARADAVPARDTPEPRGAPAPRVGARRRPRVVGDLLPGDHLCAIYETDADQRAAIVPYLRLGLERGEKVLYIVDAGTAEAVLADLRRDGVDVDAHLASGQLANLTRNETYVRDGVFDPAAMIDTLRAATDQAVTEGYPALRVTGEMTWALRGLPGSERLIEYEARLNDFLPGSRCLALCQYDGRRFDPGVLLEVLRTHPHVAVGAEIAQNPYYLPPAEVLNVDRPATDLARWTRNLVGRSRDADELNTARERSEAIVASMRDGFAVADAAGVILSVNPALCAMTGFSADELVGVGPPHPYWPPEDVAIIGAALARAVQGESADFERTFRRKDGERFPVVVRSSVIRDETGRIVAVFASVRDDTERTRAVQALHESERRLRAILETMSLIGAILDTKGLVTFCNDFLLDLTGWTRDEVLGKSWFDLFLPPDIREVVRNEVFLTSIATGDLPLHYENEIVTRQGERRLVAWNNTVLRDAAGQVESVASIGEDITERRRAEEGLRASEAGFRALIEEAPDGIFIADTDGRYVDVNPAGCAMLDHTPEEILQKTIHDLVRLGPAEALRLDQLRQGKSLLTEREMIRKDGSAVPVEISATKLPDGRLLGIVRDVSERNRLQAQLLQSQKMETVGRLAGGVAHDFNNLLAVVIGNAELARAGLDAADPRSVAIAEVEDAAHRGVALTRQLLAFTQQQVASPEVLDINAVVREMDRMLRRIIGETITFTFIEGEPAGRVRADHAGLGQILMNLAANARDSMPTGGTLLIETGTVVLGAADAGRPPSVAPGRYVTVMLADTGTGMEAETRARLFEPFFTTKGPGQGSGLGLSTAQGIARQSGGDLLLVESEPGGGSTFTLYLPAVDVPVPAPRSSSVAPAAVGTETILLVEDDAGVRRLAQRILVDAGYTVLTAGDGVEALAVLAAQTGRVDLVVSDVIMPKIGGPELARRVAETRPDTAILLTSGYPGDIPAGEGEIPAGAHFIGKPYAAAELTAKVRDVLGG